MRQKFAYFIGGSADQVKMAIPEEPFRDVFLPRFSGTISIVNSESVRPVDFKNERYVLRTMPDHTGRPIYLYIYQGDEEYSQ